MTRGARKAHRLALGLVAAGALLGGLERSAAAVGPEPGREHALRVLDELAARERSARELRTWLWLGGGATLTVTGVVGEFALPRPYGRVTWLLGASAALQGVYELLVPGSLEVFEEEADGYDAGELEAVWRDLAARDRSQRRTTAWTGVAMGGLSLVMSGLLFAGLGEGSDAERRTWATILGGGGVLFTGVGIAGLSDARFLQSDIELGLERAYPSAVTGNASSLNIGLAPTRSGATLQLLGSF